MNYENTTYVESLLKINAEVVPFEKLSPPWQNKLTGACASNHPPSHLVFPHTEEATAEIVTIAQEKQIKLLCCGNGTKLNWGGLTQDVSLAISTCHLNKLIEHASADLTVTAQAGMKLKDLQDILLRSNQFLPIDPSYPESATIGGIVATADTGSWRLRYGGIRDLILGLSFVRADGKIAKAGGRVVKNVAGYDLMKLFTGSYGTLGIISQVTFRVYPISPASGTIVLTGNSDRLGNLAQNIIKTGLTPNAGYLISQKLVKHFALGEEGIGLIARFGSISESVDQQLQQLNYIGEQLGLKTSYYREGDELSLWKQLNSQNLPIFCKIGVLPTAAIEFLNQGDYFAKINLSSGNGTLEIEEEKGKEVLLKLRKFTKDQEGFLTILTAPKALKEELEPWGYSGNALKIMKQIKQQFDGKNIFNPGRFVGGI